MNPVRALQLMRGSRAEGNLPIARSKWPALEERDQNSI